MTADQFGKFLETAYAGLHEIGWHWFMDQIFLGPSPFVESIMRACASIDDRAPGIGTELFVEMISIGGRERDEGQYEQLLQKLAEILVIERIVNCEWPEGTAFEHEPAAAPGGRRPELLVTHPGGRLVVEVKTPALLRHIRARAENNLQVPYRRAHALEVAEGLGRGNATRPRDNPILEFLRDSDLKFEGFRIDGTSTLLVIVWDDFIYEPISTLVNVETGLLTDGSFARHPDGTAIRFGNIDAVVALRHLQYFLLGSRGQPLVDRESAMDFGGQGAFPNVLFPAHGGRPLPEFVIEALRAVPHDNDGLRLFAEYNPQDMVMWFRR